MTTGDRPRAPLKLPGISAAHPSAPSMKPPLPGVRPSPAPGVVNQGGRQAITSVTPVAAREREFEFTGADFERIRTLIHQYAGIVLSPAKQDMVYGRLTRRLRACGNKTFAQYLQRLECDRPEREIFVNALTTNLTSFFREAHHFDILADHLRALKTRDGAHRLVRIWCCAASTGEEPYSLAMTACEAFDTLSPPVRIIASDIDTDVLAQGERGMFHKDRVERLSAQRLQHFFLQGGKDDPVRVRPELQRLIAFRRINLLDPGWAVQGPLDALFCRNVMIYFDKPTQYRILKRFAPLLRREGLLFAGHSESLSHAADLFRSLGRTIYACVETR